MEKIKKALQCFLVALGLLSPLFPYLNSRFSAPREVKKHQISHQEITNKLKKDFPHLSFLNVWDENLEKIATYLYQLKEAAPRPAGRISSLILYTSENNLFDYCWCGFAGKNNKIILRGKAGCLQYRNFAHEAAHLYHFYLSKAGSRFDQEWLKIAGEHNSNPSKVYNLTTRLADPREKCKRTVWKDTQTNEPREEFQSAYGASSLLEDVATHFEAVMEENFSDLNNQKTRDKLHLLCQYGFVGEDHLLCQYLSGRGSGLARRETNSPKNLYR